jgi:hypothetical protein
MRTADADRDGRVSTADLRCALAARSAQLASMRPPTAPSSSAAAATTAAVTQLPSLLAAGVGAGLSPAALQLLAYQYLPGGGVAVGGGGGGVAAPSSPLGPAFHGQTLLLTPVEWVLQDPSYLPAVPQARGRGRPCHDGVGSARQGSSGWRWWGCHWNLRDRDSQPNGR